MYSFIYIVIYIEYVLKKFNDTTKNFKPTGLKDGI